MNKEFKMKKYYFLLFCFTTLSAVAQSDICTIKTVSQGSIYQAVYSEDGTKLSNGNSKTVNVVNDLALLRDAGICKEILPSTCTIKTVSLGSIYQAVYSEDGTKLSNGNSKTVNVVNDLALLKDVGICL